MSVCQHTSMFLGQLHHLLLTLTCAGHRRADVAECHGLSTLMSGFIVVLESSFPLLYLAHLLLAPFELNGRELHIERHARSDIIQRVSGAIHVATRNF